MTIVNDRNILLLAIGLGSIGFFSFVVAPSAFALLPTRESAGTLVNPSLIQHYHLAYGLVGLILIEEVLVTQNQSPPGRHFFPTHSFITHNISIILMLLVTLCSALKVSRRMDPVRRMTGPRDLMAAATYPLRASLKRWREVSVWLVRSNRLFSVGQLFVVAKTRD